MLPSACVLSEVLVERVALSLSCGAVSLPT